MTYAESRDSWTLRLLYTLEQGIPQLVTEAAEQALLQASLTAATPLPDDPCEVRNLLAQITADRGPAELAGVQVTTSAPLLQLTLRLLRADLLPFLPTPESLTWSGQHNDSQGLRLSLRVPLSRQQLWRHYFLVGADFLTADDPFREYRRLWLGYLFHCLAEWGVVIATDTDATGQGELVFTFPSALPSVPHRTGPQLLQKYLRELQRSRQQVGAFYQLAQCHHPRPLYTAIQRAELDWPLGPKFILVDGLVPETGRTTVMLNLALSLAQEWQQNVLCLDSQATPRGQWGYWPLPPWQSTQVQPQDLVFTEDFHRQLHPVAERLTLAGYWGGQDEFWLETMRQETSAFDLVLIECHQLGSDHEIATLQLADLVLLAAGLQEEELAHPASLVSYESMRRFQALPSLPVKILWQQRPDQQIDQALLRLVYQELGSDFLGTEIGMDTGYRTALRTRQPVLSAAPQSLAARSYRAAAGEILRLVQRL